MPRIKSITDADVFIGSFTTTSLLKAVDTTNATTYPQLCTSYTTDNGTYYLDRTSSATESLPNIVQPTSGTGRWYLIGSPGANNLLSKISNIETAANTGLSFTSNNKLVVSTTTGQGASQVDNLEWDSVNNKFQIRSSLISVSPTIEFFNSANSVSDTIKQTNLVAYTESRIKAIGKLSLYNMHFPSSLVGYAVGVDDTGSAGQTKQIVIKTTDGGNTWSDPITIANDPGTMFCCHFISDTVGFAGAGISDGTGVIYKTIDGGQNWTINLTTASDMTALYFVNSTHGWAAHYNTIYKTTDGGGNWTPISVGLSAIYEIKFISTTNGVAFGSGGTLSECIMKTTDGGATWIEITIDANVAELYKGFYLDSSNVYAAGYSNTGTTYVAHSNDGGSTWSVLPTISGVAFLYGIHVTDVNTIYLAGNDFGNTQLLVLKSINAGNSFSTVKTITAGANYLNPYDLKFTSATTGYIIGVAQPTSGVGSTFNVLYKTTDSGTTWNNTAVSGFGNLEMNGIAFPSSSIGYAVGTDDTGKGVYIKTTDSGTTWTSPALVQNSTQLKGIHFLNTTSGWICGGQTISIRGTIHKTTNSGSTWTNTAITSTTVFNDIFMTSLTSGIAVGNSGATIGKLSRSTDGTTWGSAVTISNSANLLGVYFPSTTVGFIVGTNTGSTVGIYSKTIDSGNAWTAGTQITGTKQLNSVLFADTSIGYAVGFNSSNQGVIVKTIDGGTTWSSPVIISTVTTINKIIAQDASILYAVGNTASSTSVVLKSIDAGATWTTQQTVITADSSKLNSIVNIPTSNYKYVVGTTSLGKGSILYSTSDFTNASGLTFYRNGDLANKATLTNLATPIDSSDAATKGYVDTTLAAIPVGSTTTSGFIRVATSAEAIAGTSSSLAISPATFTFGYTTSNKLTLTNSTTGKPVQMDNLEWLPSTDTLQIQGTTVKPKIKLKDNLVTSNDNYIESLNEVAWSFLAPLPNGSSQTQGFWSSGDGSTIFVSGQANGGIVAKSTNYGDTWTILFPANLAVTNQLRDVFFIGNTGWTGGASGSPNDKIFKTTDGGQTWDAGTSANGITVVNKIFFLTTSIGWACGDNAISRTTDGGATWSAAVTVSNQWGDNYTGNFIFIDANTGFKPARHSTFNYAGVHRTTNGGVSWTFVAVDTTNNSIATDVFYINSILYVVTIAGKLYKSTDLGLTYTYISTVDSPCTIKKIYFTSANTVYAAGSTCASNQGTGVAKIYKSRDGGRTWSSILTGSTTTNASSVNVNNLFFPNGQVGYYLQQNTYGRTKTEGHNLVGLKIYNNTTTTRAIISNVASPQADWDVVNLEYFLSKIAPEGVLPLSGGTLSGTLTVKDLITQSDPSVYYDGKFIWRNSLDTNTDVVIKRTINPWSSVTNNTAIGRITHSFYDGTNLYAIGTGANGLTYQGSITKNTSPLTSNTWSTPSLFITSFSNGLVDHTSIGGIHFSSTSIGYIAAADGASSVKVAKTTDGGTTWTALSVTSMTTKPCGITFLPSSSTTGMVISNNATNNFSRTTNGGSAWSTQTLLSGGLLPQAIYFFSSTIGYIAGNGKIAKSSNGGSTWTLVGTTPLASGSNAPIDTVKQIYFESEFVGYAIGNNTAGTASYMSKTIDGGLTWNGILFPIALMNGGVSKMFFPTNKTIVVVGSSNQSFGSEDSFIYTAHDAGNGANLSWKNYTLSGIDGAYSYFQSGNIGYVFGYSDQGNTTAASVILRTTEANSHKDALQVYNNTFETKVNLGNLAQPHYPQDAATRKYVDDSILEGLNPISVVKGQLTYLQANNLLNKGSYYKVTDPQDTGSIYLQALDVNQISNSGKWLRPTAIKAFGYFSINTVVATNNISQVTVGATTLMTSTITYSSGTKLTFANSIAANINANSTVSGYRAVVIGGSITYDVPVIVIEKTAVGVDTSNIVITASGTSTTILRNMLQGQASVNELYDCDYVLASDRVTKCHDPIRNITFTTNTTDIASFGYNPISNFPFGNSNYRNFSIGSSRWINVFNIETNNSNNVIGDNNAFQNLVGSISFSSSVIENNNTFSNIVCILGGLFNIRCGRSNTIQNCFMSLAPACNLGDVNNLSDLKFTSNFANAKILNNNTFQTATINITSVTNAQFDKCLFLGNITGTIQESYFNNCQIWGNNNYSVTNSTLEDVLINKVNFSNFNINSSEVKNIYLVNAISGGYNTTNLFSLTNSVWRDIIKYNFTMSSDQVFINSYYDDGSFKMYLFPNEFFIGNGTTEPFDGSSEFGEDGSQIGLGCNVPDKFIATQVIVEGESITGSGTLEIGVFSDQDAFGSIAMSALTDDKLNLVTQSFINKINNSSEIRITPVGSNLTGNIKLWIEGKVGI